MKIASILLSSDLLIFETAHWESKWYSRNNRRFWCIREAAVIAEHVRVGSTDRAFLHVKTKRKGGRAVVFFPSSVCKACGKEYVNRTKLHNHNRQRMFELAAQTALASRKRLAARWRGEWPSSASPWWALR